MSVDVTVVEDGIEDVIEDVEGMDGSAGIEDVIEDVEGMDGIVGTEGLLEPPMKLPGPTSGIAGKLCEYTGIGANTANAKGAISSHTAITACLRGTLLRLSSCRSMSIPRFDIGSARLGLTNS